MKRPKWNKEKSIDYHATETPKAMNLIENFPNTLISELMRPKSSYNPAKHMRTYTNASQYLRFYRPEASSHCSSINSVKQFREISPQTY